MRLGKICVLLIYRPAVYGIAQYTMPHQSFQAFAHFCFFNKTKVLSLKMSDLYLFSITLWISSLYVGYFVGGGDSTVPFLVSAVVPLGASFVPVVHNVYMVQ